MIFAVRGALGAPKVALKKGNKGTNLRA